MTSRVAQRSDGHDRPEPTAILADVGQLVDVLDPARGLEHQGLEARRDRGSELDAQRFGARDQLLRIGNIGRRDSVRHVGGRVAKHPLGADVEDLNDTVRVGGDAREVGSVEDRALQSPRLEQRLFRLLARSVVGALGDADPRARLVVSISHGVAPVLALVQLSASIARLQNYAASNSLTEVLEADGTIAGRTRESRSTPTYVVGSKN